MLPVKVELLLALPLLKSGDLLCQCAVAGSAFEIVLGAFEPGGVGVCEDLSQGFHYCLRFLLVCATPRRLDHLLGQRRQLTQSFLSLPLA